MSGARNLEELNTSIAYEEAPEEERDYAAALAAPAQDQLGGPLYVLRPLRPLSGGH